MKKLVFLFSLFVGVIANAQILDYNDFGILLTSENKLGTARTMAMKNAFGALGGDLSAININPAGAAVFSQSAAAFTLGNNKTDIQSIFYGTNTSQINKHTSLSQAGGVLLFFNDDEEDYSNWKKVSVAINMNTLHDFDGSWVAKGLTSSTWTNETIQYNTVDSQKYSNFKEGSLTNVNFALAAQYGNSLYLGASFNAYDVEYIEDSKREEKANDGLGNSIDAFESFWQEVKGEGFSFSGGLIFKPIQNLRLGLSYTTPVWYEMTEESNMFSEDEDDVFGYYDIIYSDDDNIYSNNIDKIQTYDYEIRTPSKTTGSIAYIFGDKGLISADLTAKNYKGIHFGNGDIFDVENKYFNDHLTNTFKVNLGTEWRFKKISLRGGYSYEQTPYVDAIETDDIRGYALGLGYDFGNFTVDLAYDYKENTDFYNFYPDITGVNGAELTKNNKKLLATVSFKF
ncbi:MAG TPA: hemin receptor [Lutibacter sp.]|nr:hemin receptor [Lutibacter sp.]